MLVSRAASGDFADRPPHVLDTIVFCARELTQPNLRFNASTTEVQRDVAAAAIQPVTSQYQRGQVIVRAGEPRRDR